MKNIYNTPKPWLVASIIWHIFGGRTKREGDDASWKKGGRILEFKKGRNINNLAIELTFLKRDIDLEEDHPNLESRICQLAKTLKDIGCTCDQEEISGGIRLKFFEKKIGLFLIITIVDQSY